LITAFILLSLAIAPGIVIVLYVYLKDHEPEPLHLLGKCLLGGTLSIIPAVLLELFFDFLGLKNDVNNYILTAGHALSIGFSEEIAKYYVLLFIAYSHKDFDEPYDGIVYSIMVGMGFATIENIMYVLEGGTGVALLRMFTSVPAHASFATLMGFFVGLSKFGKNPFVMRTLGLWLAILFHAAYDFFLFTGNAWLIFLGGLGSLLIGVWLSFKAMKWHRDISPFKPS
jgi:RsiW-degrading membrane proteinase PrsW (M82 family)